MKTFIKVTEIWLPDRERTRLVFGSGLYGSLTEFRSASEHQHFGYDEGLPGKAWASGHPIVMSHFEPTYFKRTQAAKKAGLTCGIALPVFSGEFLLAVVVFLCGDDQDHAGAIEVWQRDAADQDCLAIMDGYFGSLDYFASISRTIKMPKGKGLPGLAWERKMPVLIENIAEAEQFLRADDARKAGISTGISIPVGDDWERPYVMTFLSARTTPIAKRIQIWKPEGHQLVCQTAYSKTENELAMLFETQSVEKGVGALGRVWLSGLPVITGDVESADYNTELDALSSMLALPVIGQGRMKAIVTFLF